MPKLYFRHGAVSSAKTLNLLAVAHNYKTQGKNVILMKVNVTHSRHVADINKELGVLSACTGRSLG
jgi:thymidine kinase